MDKNFSVKDDVKLEDLLSVHPKLLYLLSAYVDYAHSNGLHAEITSIISDRDNVDSKSKTHEQGRAIDISINGWSKVHIHQFVFRINTEYREIAAISSKDNQPRSAVYGDANHKDHIHLQVRP